MTEENNSLANLEEVPSAPLKTMPDLKALRELRGLTTEDVYLSVPTF